MPSNECHCLEVVDGIHKTFCPLFMACPNCGAAINPAAEMAKHRASKQTAERRKAIASKAGAIRWSNQKARKTTGAGPPGDV